jgi:hypothetical protein
MHNHLHSLRQIFAMPIVLGVLSAIGLLAALLGDGIWDTVSWLTLAYPISILCRHVWRRAS